MSDQQDPPIDRRECGGNGVHPSPIGGGWALACDACKTASPTEPQGDTGEPLTEDDWRAWRDVSPLTREEVTQ